MHACVRSVSYRKVVKDHDTVSQTKDAACGSVSYRKVVKDHDTVSQTKDAACVHSVSYRKVVKDHDSVFRAICKNRYSNNVFGKQIVAIRSYIYIFLYTYI